MLGVGTFQPFNHFFRRKPGKDGMFPNFYKSWKQVNVPRLSPLPEDAPPNEAVGIYET